VGLLRSIRTAWSLAERVDELADEIDDLRADWIDKKDAFELLLKRLATRDSRARRDDGDVARAPATDLPPGVDKQTLREVARARGLIR
jgi:hypothetical protein